MSEEREFRRERDRLDSFSEGWPHAFIPPALLAKVGFFYNPSKIINDRVTCFHCRTNISNWRAGDDPNILHKEIAPYCNFFLGQTFDNIPYDSLTKDFFGLIKVQKPIASEFSNQFLRIASYKKKNWPKRLEDMIGVLADSGLYYTGIADHTRCYSCNILLKNWSIQIDAWRIHIWHNPHCYHVNLQKGHKFIQKILNVSLIIIIIHSASN